MIMSNLINALKERFTDKDEINDIAKYGAHNGVNGFIYSSELYDFFNKYEDDIEEIMNDRDLMYTDLIKGDHETFQQLREAAVWFVVELYCQEKISE